MLGGIFRLEAFRVVFRLRVGNNFFLLQGRDLLIGFLAPDVCSAVIRTHQFQAGGDSDDLIISSSARVLVILAAGMQSYFANKFNYQYLSVFAVATGVGQPKACLSCFQCFKYPGTTLAKDLDRSGLLCSAR